MAYAKFVLTPKLVLAEVLAGAAAIRKASGASDFVPSTILDALNVRATEREVLQSPMLSAA
jgi:hypothetical protein